MDLSQEGSGVCEVNGRWDGFGFAYPGAKERARLAGEIGLGRGGITCEAEEWEKGVEGQGILGLFANNGVKEVENAGLEM